MTCMTLNLFIYFYVYYYQSLIFIYLLFLFIYLLSFLFFIIIIILSFSKIFIHLFDLVNMMLLQGILPIKKMMPEYFIFLIKKDLALLLLLFIYFIYLLENHFFKWRD